jgi:anti-sigma regulatory factor (Ser/Thr protein kinase)/Na+-translocating ferredoxin:NAD+ oxidoreductase RNF subunit RnfB
MSVVSYKIKGGDFENDGAASRCVKEQLKKVGADPAVVRRAMVAAYEAEMNVVIHAYQGELRASLHEGQLDVDVVDEGPGIPDIDMAMTPGFSTASAEARQLGFGAGMGLPNIKKNSDRFAIESTPGKGTRVSFSIFLKPQALYGLGQHAVHVVAESCNECLACIRVCPTQALRVFRGKPQILDYLCIDCAACIGACPTGALTLEGTRAVAGQPDGATVALTPSTETVLIVPSPCLAQFGASVTPARVLAELAALGFGEVRVTDAWDIALQAAVVDYANTTREQRVPAAAPVISPVCPAIVNLIETKFPLLIPNIAPFLSGLEAAHTNVGGKRPMSVVLCPCQHTAILSGEPAGSGAATKPEIIVPSMLRAAVMPRLKPHAETTGPQPRSVSEADGGPLQVTGLRHVLKVLEAIEDGLVGDVAVIELFACEGGCFGSPLLGEDASLASYRWQQAREQTESRAQAVRRAKAYSPRRGLRLDADMSKAIAKLGKIDKLARSLPGSNCGICGAPTCAALAEDIILGRATREACLRQQQNAGQQGTGTSGDQEKAT